MAASCESSFSRAMRNGTSKALCIDVGKHWVEYGMVELTSQATTLLTNYVIGDVLTCRHDQRPRHQCISCMTADSMSEVS